MRAVSGEKTAFAYSDDISLNALSSAAQATRAIALQGGGGSTQIAHRGGGHNLYVPRDPLASLDDAAKVSLLEKIERKARALDSRVTQVMASLAGEYEVMLVARSDGVTAASSSRAIQGTRASGERSSAPAAPAPPSARISARRRSSTARTASTTSARG